MGLKWLISVFLLISISCFAAVKTRTEWNEENEDDGDEETVLVGRTININAQLGYDERNCEAKRNEVRVVAWVFGLLSLFLFLIGLFFYKGYHKV